MGDRAAEQYRTLDEFFAGVERRAYRMAWLASGHREDALDIVQDAMIRLTERYADRDPAEWGPLFHRVLQTRITDWHRRHAVRSRFRGFLRRFGGEEEAGEDPIEQVPDRPHSQPDAEQGRDESFAALESAIRALPLRQQQAFLLRAWEQLSTAETAAAMGCSEGSVKTHYSRACAALRGQLEEHRP